MFHQEGSCSSSLPITSYEQGMGSFLSRLGAVFEHGRGPSSLWLPHQAGTAVVDKAREAWRNATSSKAGALFAPHVEAIRAPQTPAGD